MCREGGVGGAGLCPYEWAVWQGLVAAGLEGEAGRGASTNVKNTLCVCFVIVVVVVVVQIMRCPVTAAW